MYFCTNVTDMKIERNLLDELVAWKDNPSRKPLLLQGARQVGKSFILKQFGNQYFANYCYVNFDFESEIKSEFSRTKDPAKLITILSIVKGIDIKPGKTLIIFDEIQECNDALNSLKYFNELLPAQAVACAGSLIGVALKRKGSSFPVGNVDILTLFPVSFKEFLPNFNDQLFKFTENFINSGLHETVPDIFHSQLIDAYKTYLCCGGMPEAIVKFLKTKSWQQTDKVNSQILTAYALDFAKHIDSKDIPRLYKLWHNVQDNLAKEDRKFRYALIEKSARAREYENAVEWLVLSGLVNRVFEVTTPRLPLNAYKNSSAFKLYFVDSGLLRTKLHLSPVDLIQGNSLFTEFRGVLTENYVLQSLIRQFGNEVFYWSSGNQAELEFMFENNSRIIPVEVKSALSIKSKSLSEYRKKYLPELSLRFSLKNLEKNKDLINLPLYLSDWLNRLI